MTFPKPLIIPTLTITTLGVLILGGVMINGKGEEVMETEKVNFTTQQTYNVGGIGFIQGLGATECSITPECTAPDCTTITVAKILGDGLNKENTCKSFKIPTTTWEKAIDGGTTSVNSVLSAKGFDPLDWVVDDGLLCKDHIFDNVIITEQYDCKEDGKSEKCEECKKVGRPDPDCDGKGCFDENNKFHKALSMRQAKNRKGECAKNLETCLYDGKRIAGPYNPNTAETCNFKDDNCNGKIDDGISCKICKTDLDCKGGEKCYPGYPNNICAPKPVCGNNSCQIPTSQIKNIDSFMCKVGKAANKGNVIVLGMSLKRFCEGEREAIECNCFINPNTVYTPSFTNSNKCSEIKELIDRYMLNFKDDFSREIEIALKYIQYEPLRTQERKTEYMHHEIAKAALEKYLLLLDKEITSCNFDSIADFQKKGNQYIKSMEYINEQALKQFPHIVSVIEEWTDFNNNLEQVKKQYGFTTESSIKEYHNKLSSYNNEIKSIQGYDEKKYNDTIKELENPSTDNIEEYFHNLNYIKTIQNEITKKQKKYDINKLKKFISFNASLNKLIKEANRGIPNASKNVSHLEWLETEIKKYNDWKTNILNSPVWENQKQEFDMFLKNFKTCEQKGRYEKFVNVQKINDKINNPYKSQICFPKTTTEKIAEIDAILSNDINMIVLKLRDPLQYGLTTLIQGGWNGLVSGVRGTLTSWYFSLAGIIDSDAGNIANAKYQEKLVNIFQITIETAAKMPLVKDGKLNLNIANTLNAVGYTMGEMLPNIYSAKLIGNTIWQSAKFGITIQNANQIGLFTSSMIQFGGKSYLEGIQNGLSKYESFGFAVMNSVGSSILELFSPNKLIRGDRSPLLTKLAGAAGKKKIFLEIAKNYGKEILEENFTESMQLIYESGIKNYANENWGSDFEIADSRADFGATTIITTLSTAFLQIPGSISQGNQTRQNAIEFILQDTSRFNYFITEIDSLIQNPQKIPKQITIQALIELKKELLNHKQYYPGKDPHFTNPDGTPVFSINDTINNSKLRDQGIDAVRARIIQLVKQHVGIDITISDAQMDLIKQAHEIESIMGEITMQQLFAKTRLLHQAFDEVKYTDVKTEKNKEAITRLLLEGGFCGSLYPTQIKNKNNIEKINEAIKGKQAIFYKFLTDTFKHKDIRDFLMHIYNTDTDNRADIVNLFMMTDNYQIQKEFIEFYNKLDKRLINARLTIQNPFTKKQGKEVIPFSNMLTSSQKKDLLNKLSLYSNENIIISEESDFIIMCHNCDNGKKGYSITLDNGKLIGILSRDGLDHNNYKGVFELDFVQDDLFLDNIQSGTDINNRTGNKNTNSVIHIGEIILIGGQLTLGGHNHLIEKKGSEQWTPYQLIKR